MKHCINFVLVQIFFDTHMHIEYIGHDVGDGRRSNGDNWVGVELNGLTLDIVPYDCTRLLRRSLCLCYQYFVSYKFHFLFQVLIHETKKTVCMALPMLR